MGDCLLPASERDSYTRAAPAITGTRKARPKSSRASLSGFHSKRIVRQPAQEEASTQTRRRVTPRIYQRHGEIWVRHCREAAPIQLLRGGSGEANGEHT